MDPHQICTRCILDATVPDISFDAQGVCNYCALHDRMEKDSPTGTLGQQKILALVAEMQQRNARRKYDCIIGVSGGTDSMYLLHLARNWGLRPLAMHLDNGWDSAISVANIQAVVTRLDIDLVTDVIDWEESRDVLLSFLKASVPWADIPSDMAINAALYGTAARERVPYILAGNNFRTEGKQPLAWTYGDGRMIHKIQKRFGTRRLKNFPNLTALKLFSYGFIRGIRLVRPLNHLEYSKPDARRILEQEYGWKYYGGHHHESIFTRFILAYWLPKKFNIDKRKVTFSAQVRSGKLARAEALRRIQEPPYALEKMEADRDYVTRKLGLTQEGFRALLAAPPKSSLDYPSYLGLFRHFYPLVRWGLRLIFPGNLGLLHQMDSLRAQKND